MHTRDTPEQRAIRRKGRLVMRHVEVRRRLEALSAISPVLDDAIGAWLSTVTVRRLRVAGVPTLADLLLLIRVHGYRWYRNVPRIGELVARRPVTWLGHQEQTLGPVAKTALVSLAQIGPWIKEPPARSPWCRPSGCAHETGTARLHSSCRKQRRCQISAAPPSGGRALDATHPRTQARRSRR